MKMHDAHTMLVFIKYHVTEIKSMITQQVTKELAGQLASIHDVLGCPSKRVEAPRKAKVVEAVPVGGKPVSSEERGDASARQLRAWLWVLQIVDHSVHYECRRGRQTAKMFRAPGALSMQVSPSTRCPTPRRRKLRFVALGLPVAPWIVSGCHIMCSGDGPIGEREAMSSSGPTGRGGRGDPMGSGDAMRSGGPIGGGSGSRTRARPR